MKSENSVNLEIFKFLIEILSFKFSRTLNISDLLSSASTQIRLSSFNSFLISLTQINNLEISNHEINHICFLISHKMIIEIKISAIIKIRAEKEIETEIETETETEIMNMKIEVKIKIMIEDSDSIAMSV